MLRLAKPESISGTQTFQITLFDPYWLSTELRVYAGHSSYYCAPKVEKKD